MAEGLPSAISFKSAASRAGDAPWYRLGFVVVLVNLYIKKKKKKAKPRILGCLFFLSWVRKTWGYPRSPACWPQAGGGSCRRRGTGRPRSRRPAVKQVLATQGHRKGRINHRCVLLLLGIALLRLTNTTFTPGYF